MKSAEERNKIKEKSDNERIKLWYKHFKELIGKNIKSTINSEKSRYGY